MAMSDPEKVSCLHKLKDIHTFVFDMDGVLTNGKLFISNSEEWFRTMSVKDGYALQLAIKKGYRILVLSGSDAPSVKKRMEKLGVNNVFFKVKDKKTFLENFFKENNIFPENVLYMGDDIPDAEAMAYCGISACPADSVSEIIDISEYISPFRGGEGCVRDVIEKVMKIHGKWNHNSEIIST